MIVPPPGPRSRALATALDRHEAPGVNTLSVAAAPGAAEPYPPIVWRAARGANVWDVDGNRYLDLTSGFGVAAVGHRHPRVVAAVRRQAGILLHGLGDVHAHPGRIELAARLAHLAAPVLAPPPGHPGSSPPLAEPQVFFATSGSEAVEIALKTALAATGRPGIIAFFPSYHGLTLGALAVTSRPEFRAPFAAHLHPNVTRLPFGCPPELLAAALAGASDQPLAIDPPTSPDADHPSSQPPARPPHAGGVDLPPASAPRPVGAVIVEPIVGREGILLPPPGWLRAVARLCREAGALLIADEIFTGFGRTGTLFACQAEGTQPDLLCCGKALGGGLPIGAVLARRELFTVWRTTGEALHTSTFLANPLACAAALAVLDIVEARRLPARAARLGTRLARRLAQWPNRHPQVQSTRGRGLLWAVELRTRSAAAALVAAARRRGLLLLAGGPAGTVAQLVPPLTITERQLNHALDLIEELLTTLAP
jgi:4-aminobutyrate aminotransferase-like enzyme